MTSISKTMLFFGTEDFSATILQCLLDAGFPIEAVVTKPDTKSGRGHKLTPSPVKVLAESRHIRVLQPEKLTDIIDDIKAYNMPAGVLASYGKIIPQSVLDLFQPGIINVHPSLLPRYRGPSPIETAILNGDEKTGVSIMKLVAAMDAGPVYVQADAAVRTPAERAYEHLADIGGDLLVKSLPAILDGTLQPQEQLGNISYTEKIKKSDGIIDWSKSAEYIERQIDAYHKWPQSRTTLGNLEVIITAAHAVPSSNGKPGHIEIINDPGILMVHSSEGYLCIDKLKPLGKKEMPVKAFLQGYRSQL